MAIGRFQVKLPIDSCRRILYADAAWQTAKDAYSTRCLVYMISTPPRISVLLHAQNKFAVLKTNKNVNMSRARYHTTSSKTIRQAIAPSYTTGVDCNPNGQLASPKT